MNAPSASRGATEESLPLPPVGPSRGRHPIVNVEAATTGGKSWGAGLEILWGVPPTPFGPCLLGTTHRGICELSFVADGDADGAIEEMHRRWPAATMRHDPEGSGVLLDRIFAPGTDDPALPLLLRGTEFQLRVWRALLAVPRGTVATYHEIARSIDSPTAARAVGGAVGANRLAYIVPCHRVIRSTGALGDYRWGADRKRAILAWELQRQLPAARAALHGSTPVSTII